MTVSCGPTSVVGVVERLNLFDANMALFHCQAGCLAPSFRQREFRLAQKTAIGFKGDPVPPGTANGAAEKRNSTLRLVNITLRFLVQEVS